MHAREREELEAQLSAYLDDELTAKERALVESWLEHDREAQALLEDLRAVRAGLQALPRAQGSADLIEQMRSRLERRALLGEEGPVGEAIRTPSLPGRRWVAAAAVIALTFVAGYVTWSFREPELPLAGDRLASAPQPEAQTPFRPVPSELAEAGREKVEISPSAAPAPAQPPADRPQEVALRSAPEVEVDTTERLPSPALIDDVAVAVEHAEPTFEDAPPAVARGRASGVASPSFATETAAAQRDGIAPPADDEGLAIRDVADAEERTPAASPASPKSLAASPPRLQIAETRQVPRVEAADALILKEAVSDKQLDSPAEAERPSLPVLANRAVSTLAPPSPSAEYETARKLEPTSPSPARGYSVLMRSARRVPVPSATAPSPASQPASAPASQPASQPAP